MKTQCSFDSFRSKTIQFLNMVILDGTDSVMLPTSSSTDQQTNMIREEYSIRYSVSFMPFLSHLLRDRVLVELLH